jgi:hypothetical protein
MNSKATERLYRERLEFGHTGDLGQTKPRYHEGVFQRVRDGHPSPIGYVADEVRRPIPDRQAQSPPLVRLANADYPRVGVTQPANCH